MNHFRVDHVGQAIRTQEVDVVGLDPVFGDFGRHDGLDAERTRDKILVERIARLLGREHTTVDLFLQQRMVACELLEFFTTQPIAARVADVADGHAIAAKNGGNNGGPHAGALRARLRGFIDALVGRRDLLLQQQRTMGEAALDVDLGELTPGFKLRHHAVGHDVDRDTAGNLAGAVAAHAISQHRDACHTVDEDGILVVGPNHARVRQAGDIEGNSFRHGWQWQERGDQASLAASSCRRESVQSIRRARAQQDAPARPEFALMLEVSPSAVCPFPPGFGSR